MNKPKLPLQVSQQETTEELLQFQISEMLYFFAESPLGDANGFYLFLQMLDVANLLDLATESINWDNLPWEIVFVGPVDGDTLLKGLYNGVHDAGLGDGGAQGLSDWTLPTSELPEVD